MTIDGQAINCIGSIGASSQSYLKVLKTPASMGEQAFYGTTISEGGTIYLAKLVLTHLAGRLNWRRVSGNEVLRYELNAKPGQQLYFETDAEPHLLPSHEKKEVKIRIDVSPQKKPFRIFATNPDLTKES